jgi:ribosomal protein L24
MIEKGQVLSLKVRFNNSGDVANVAHPVLVMDVNKEKKIIEVAHIDSITKEKEWKALLKSNVRIKNTNPDETVIDKDSFVQVDNIIQLEYFKELENKRRQFDKLSDIKFQKVLNRYNMYKNNNLIDDNKKVYMSKEEILKLNADVLEVK